MSTARYVPGLALACLCALLIGCDQGASNTAQNGTGSAETPESLTFVFQKQKDPAEIKDDADAVAAFLSEQIGVPVKVQVPLDYGMSVQAMVSGKADVAYVSSIPFLLARRDADAELLLAEVRTDAQGNERTNYDSIFVVRDDSPIQSMQDIVDNASDLRMAFTSRTSTSGYVMAYRRLVKEGLLKPGQDPDEVFKSADWAGGYAKALQQVADDRADLCAVSFYTMEGESAKRYLDQETRDKLRIVARTPNVPTHLICVRGGISDQMKQKIKDALLKLSQEKSELLADVYGAKRLTEVDPEQHVAATVEAFEYLDLPVEGFVYKK